MVLPLPKDIRQEFKWYDRPPIRFTNQKMKEDFKQNVGELNEAVAKKGYFTPIIVKPSKMSGLEKIAFATAHLCEDYLSFSHNRVVSDMTQLNRANGQLDLEAEKTGWTVEEVPLKYEKNSFKYALLRITQIATFVLTGGLLPLLALIVKAGYRFGCVKCHQVGMQIILEAQNAPKQLVSDSSSSSSID